VSIKPGTIISYREMCDIEGTSLQRGMNYRLNPGYSVILMSLRPGAPYADRVEDDGKLLIYEGHDEPRRVGGADPKRTDQPLFNPGGSFTQNGQFFEAARKYKSGQVKAERVRVYEKIKSGIWVYNGLFHLLDAWQEQDGNRNVYKFKLFLTANDDSNEKDEPLELDHSRMIPAGVKIEVWKRDNGRCVICGSDKNLHFDHIIPYSKGGTSLKSENIQLLCATHNLSKRDKIE
jgi:hypothetical protein